MTVYEPERSHAITALTHRLAALGIGEPEVHALEYVTALMGQGWRPTPARKPTDWRVSEPQPPEVAEHGIAAVREALHTARKETA